MNQLLQFWQGKTDLIACCFQFAWPYRHSANAIARTRSSFRAEGNWDRRLNCKYFGRPRSRSQAGTLDTSHLFIVLKQKNFYNQRFVFGILTTLDEWKICWLNDTDKCARSDEIIQDTFISRFQPNLEREIYSSKVYKHTDPDLTRVLLSAMTVE